MPSGKQISDLSEEIGACLLQENMERSIGFPYQKARVRFNWHVSTQDPIQTIRYDYEQKLYTLLKKNSISSEYHENRPIIIIGGRGSGKSTAVVNLLKRLESEGIANHIRIDMNQWDDRALEDKSEAKLQARFAIHLSEKISKIFPREPGLEDIHHRFLPWCLDHRSDISDMVAHIGPLSTFLTQKFNHIRKVQHKESYGRRDTETHFEYMVDEFDKMISMLSDLDRVWYQLFNANLALRLES